MEAEILKTNIMKSDVLIIGSGCAGIRAAIEASDNGAKVLMVSKLNFLHCGSSFYDNSLPWGIMMAGKDANLQSEFIDEILESSCGCIDSELTKILVENSNERFEDLCGYGVRFSINDDKPCFGNHVRGAQALSLKNVRECLTAQLIKRDIKVLSNIYISDLIVEDNICYGAIGIDKQNNIVSISSKTTILATGGAENLWEYGFGSGEMNGDAYSMAAKAGARLTNLEFIQFIPGSISPLKGINFYHKTLDTIPQVLDSYGNEFIHQYIPDGIGYETCLKERANHGPFSFEDNSRYFDIAIYKEETKGSPDDIKGVQVKYNSTYFCGKKFVIWDNFLMSKGINTKKDSISIYPFCQSFNGGILINKNCETDVKNLYACGECAGGQHGANRIGGNAVLDTQVFGKIAGENAANNAKKVYGYFDNDYSTTAKKLYDTGMENHYEPDSIFKIIKSIMQYNACIIRERSKLEKSIKILEQIQKNFNPLNCIKSEKCLSRGIDAYNSIIAGRLILHSILNRNESRGGHYRSDFPYKTEGKFADMKIIKFNMKNNKCFSAI